jgi:hypothetical protein
MVREEVARWVNAEEDANRLDAVGLREQPDQVYFSRLKSACSTARRLVDLCEDPARALARQEELSEQAQRDLRRLRRLFSQRP